MIKYNLIIRWDDGEKQYEDYDTLEDAMTARDMAFQTYGDEIVEIEIVPYNPYKRHIYQRWFKGD